MVDVHRVRRFDIYGNAGVYSELHMLVFINASNIIPAFSGQTYGLHVSGRLLISLSVRH